MSAVTALVRSICPPPTDADRIAFLEAECQRLRTRVAADMRPAVLREPFELDICTRPAITNCEPDFCSEAEYVTVTARDENVLAAIDWLIDRHIKELEAKVAELEKQP